jgi:hypothetical protein
MFQYDLLVRARQRELLRAAEMAQLRRIATDARRGHTTRPEQKVDVVGRRPYHPNFAFCLAARRPPPGGPYHFRR